MDPSDQRRTRYIVINANSSIEYFGSVINLQAKRDYRSWPKCDYLVRNETQ